MFCHLCAMLEFMSRILPLGSAVFDPRQNFSFVPSYALWVETNALWKLACSFEATKMLARMWNSEFLQLFPR